MQILPPQGQALEAKSVSHAGAAVTPGPSDHALLTKAACRVTLPTPSF